MTDTVEVVYLGKRTLKGGKIGVALITRDKMAEIERDYADNDAIRWTKLAEKIDREASVFDARGVKMSAIGGLYSVDIDGLKLDETGRIKSFTFGQAKFEMAVDNDLVAAWRQMDRATQEARAAKMAEKKAANSTSLDRAVDTLRRQYQEIPGGYRQGFVVWLLRELERR